MKNKENGFSLPHILLLVLVIGLISFVGWYVWSKNNDSKTQKPEQAKTTNVRCFDGLCLTPSESFDNYTTRSANGSVQSGFNLQYKDESLGANYVSLFRWEDNFSYCSNKGCDITIISTEQLPNYPEASLIIYYGKQEYSETEAGDDLIDGFYYAQNVLSNKCVQEFDLKSGNQTNVMLNNCLIQRGNKKFALEFTTVSGLHKTIDSITEFAESQIAQDAAKVQLSLKAE